MSRTIKFRGQRVEIKEWVYGYLFEHEPPLQCISNREKETSRYFILKTGFADWNMMRPVDMVEVIAETVGQYTRTTR